MASATASCTPAGQEIQENDANGLKAKGDALGTGKQYIVGFSAANFISQTNGVAGSQLPAALGTVDLGSIDALGKPYTGAVTGPIAPSSTFYASSTYGRNIYNVLPTTVATGLGSADMKSLFVGSGSPCATPPPRSRRSASWAWVPTAAPPRSRDPSSPSPVGAGDPRRRAHAGGGHRTHVFNPRHSEPMSKGRTTT